VKVIMSSLHDDGIEMSALESSSLRCPVGFEAAGLAVGLRKSGRRDLALFLCREGANAAGVFTQNVVRAAPVTISEDNLRASGGKCRAVLINSGMANACTGPEGYARAVRTIDRLASTLRCATEEILIASTGVIGMQMPDQKMIDAYNPLLGASSANGLSDAAAAILTTDTCEKFAEAIVRHDGRTARVIGVAKGSGMIHPNMATMLGVVMTDAAIESDDLADMLRLATKRTFNRVSVDGDTSTNDCVFALASGAAGAFPRELMQEAIERVSGELALQIVRDGEGAKKVVRVRVSDANTENDAEQVAQTVASSLLVRTAIAGGDPNWGRIVAAVGRAGVPFDLDRIEVFAGGEKLFLHGAPADTPRDILKKAFLGPDVDIDIHLKTGGESAEFLTCDLTEGYIRINADYTT
jgi:glutamate N-acetyltransferase/amino-acid N-acetyltransferase